MIRAKVFRYFLASLGGSSSRHCVPWIDQRLPVATRQVTLALSHTHQSLAKYTDDSFGHPSIPGSLTVPLHIASCLFLRDRGRRLRMRSDAATGKAVRAAVDHHPPMSRRDMPNGQPSTDNVYHRYLHIQTRSRPRTPMLKGTLWRRPTIRDMHLACPSGRGV